MGLSLEASSSDSSLLHSDSTSIRGCCCCRCEFIPLEAPGPFEHSLVRLAICARIRRQREVKPSMHSMVQSSSSETRNA